MDDSPWTTRMLPEHTQSYGVEELHAAWFLPHGWSGKGPCISLGIPECETHYVMLGVDDETVTIVNRPQRNRNVKYWVRHVCRIATRDRIALFFTCDTAAQIERATRLARKRLPHHQRVALERMYDANARVFSKLS